MLVQLHGNDADVITHHIIKGNYLAQGKTADGWEIIIKL